MNLPVTQSIFHGALRPGLSPDFPFQALIRRFRILPDNLPDMDMLFISGLSDYVTFRFEQPVRINRIAPDTYTPIIEYTIDPEIDFRFDEVKQTPQLLFYKTVAHAEAERTKLALRSFAGITRSDIDTRQEVKDTLRQIKGYMHSIPHYADDIFRVVQTQLTKLYYELTMWFDALLTDDDFTPFDDLYPECYDRYPVAAEVNAYQAAALIRQTQKCIAAHTDRLHAQTLLSALYRIIHERPGCTKLTITAAALENYIYLKWSSQAIPAFEQLIHTDFVNSQVKKQKSQFKQQYEREEIALDRANIIDEIITGLPFVGPLPHPASIMHHLLLFLNGQKEIYLQIPDALFKTVIEKQPNELKKKPLSTIKPMSIGTKLTIANQHLAFLNGVNPKDGLRFMSENDYQLLVGYVEHLIQYEEIPKIIRKIPKSNIGKTWFSYTLYVIHKEFYTSIQNVWIEFIQEVFEDFSPRKNKFLTIKTKFSQAPYGYKKFIKQVLG